MGKADKLARAVQGITDRVGSGNITKETRAELSQVQKDLQSYDDKHGGNFSEISRAVQSVTDRIDGNGGNLTKSVRTELSEAQKDFQSKIDKSR